MQREEPGRPYPEETGEAQLRYAGFWIRFGAIIIDGFFLSLLYLLLSYTLPPLSYLIISPLVVAAYYVGFWVWRGQTPGKMAFRIRVVRTDGYRLTWKSVIVRYLGYFVFGAFFWFGVGLIYEVSAIFYPIPLVGLLGYFWIIIDKRKQGLHDKIAGTCVIMVQ